MTANPNPTVSSSPVEGRDALKPGDRVRYKDGSSDGIFTLRYRPLYSTFWYVEGGGWVYPSEVELVPDAALATSPASGGEAAALVRQTADEIRPPEHAAVWVKMALAIAARAVERGRHLTAAEKLANLRAGALEDGGEDGKWLADFITNRCGVPTDGR